jgi:acyl-coenzyme A synthetase/AMP-(fatty) acid ligase
VPVLNHILDRAIRDPDRLAILYNGKRTSYDALAHRVGAARQFLVLSGVERHSLAVLFVAHLEECWVLGLAARSLGLTTIIGRSPDDVRTLAGPNAIVLTLAGEGWADVEGMAAQLGTPLLQCPPQIGAADTRKGTFTVPTRDHVGGHILLTSGTTGAYKKVFVDPSFELANAARRIEIYRLNDQSLVNVFNFTGWTAAGYQTPLAVWSAGGAIVLHQGPDRWRSIRVPGTTIIYTQPQMLADLLSAPPEVSLKNDAMSLIVTAGVLSAEQWRQARDRLTSRILTGYGATETGPCTLTCINGVDDLTRHQIIPDSELQVVDQHGLALAPGETGAIRARSAYGITGYLDDAPTTNTHFRDGFFYTGDLGVIHRDGRLTIQGRVTDVINVLGHKLATLPIETALRDQLDAAEVCVFSTQLGAADEVVQVVLQLGRPITDEELKTALLAHLPRSAQVRLHSVDAFPRNEMGKIDRAKLKVQLLGETNG